jgi:mannosyltransferase OCH1-like enzyme
MGILQPASPMCSNQMRQNQSILDSYPNTNAFLATNRAFMQSMQLIHQTQKVKSTLPKKSLYLYNRCIEKGPKCPFV